MRLTIKIKLMHRPEYKMYLMNVVGKVILIQVDEQ